MALINPGMSTNWPQNLFTFPWILKFNFHFSKLYPVAVSEHCIIFFLSDVGIQDRVVIQELIKTVAQTNNLDSSQKDFKGICMHLQ